MEPETVNVGGLDIAVPIVRTALISLAGLENASPIALYELALVCRDATHVPFGRTAADMEQFGLILHLNADGTVQIHETTRAIVNAIAMIGDYGAEMDWRALLPA
jgi:hypothetical protein